jgi:hypothetical protein
MTNAAASQPSGGRAGRTLGALTNRVLAHTRIVAGFWIVLIAIPVSQLAVLGLTAIADVWFYGTGATAWMVADEKIAL